MLGAVSADLNMSASVRSRAVALTCINNSPPDLSSHHVFFGSGLPQEAGRDQEIWPQDQHGATEVSRALTLITLTLISPRRLDHIKQGQFTVAVAEDEEPMAPKFLTDIQDAEVP